MSISLHTFALGSRRIKQDRKYTLKTNVLFVQSVKICFVCYVLFLFVHSDSYFILVVFVSSCYSFHILSHFLPVQLPAPSQCVAPASPGFVFLLLLCQIIFLPCESSICRVVFLISSDDHPLPRWFRYLRLIDCLPVHQITAWLNRWNSSPDSVCDLCITNLYTIKIIVFMHKHIQTQIFTKWEAFLQDMSL